MVGALCPGPGPSAVAEKLVQPYVRVSSTKAKRKQWSQAKELPRVLSFKTTVETAGR